MQEIRCPVCAGIVCKAETPPVEGRCGSCHKIVMFDGTSGKDKARPMTVEEIKDVKHKFHSERKAKR